MPLVVALLALLFIRHYGYAKLDGVLGLNERAWFYVMGGYTEMVCWFLIFGAASMITKRNLMRALGMLAGGWGASEGAMMGTCRILATPKSSKPDDALCTLAFGIPAYYITIGTVLLILAYLLIEHYGQRNT